MTGIAPRPGPPGGTAAGQEAQTVLWATMMPSQEAKYKRNRKLGEVANGKTFCGIVPPFLGVQNIVLLHTLWSVKDLH